MQRVTPAPDEPRAASFLQLIRRINLYWVMVVGLMGLAGLTRFAYLFEIPYTFWTDEAWFVERGNEVATGRDLAPLEEPGVGVGNSLGQIYSTAAIQKLGLSYIFSSRIVTALAGTLALIALFIALRLLTPERRWAAALGLAIATVNFAFLLDSRNASQNVPCALAAILVIIGLHLTFESGSPWAAAATGIALGLSFYIYEAALALPFVVLAYGGLRWWEAFQPRGRGWRADDKFSRWRPLFLMALIVAAAGLVFLPLGWIYLNRPGIFLTHIIRTSQWYLPQEWANSNTEPNFVAVLPNTLLGIGRVWASTLWPGMGDPLYQRNWPGRPIFEPGLAVLFVVGVVLSWRRIKRRENQLLWIWAAAATLPSAATGITSFTRMVVLLPALYAFAGIGGAWLLERFNWRGAVAVVLLIGVSGVSAGLDYVKWNNDPRLLDYGKTGRVIVEAARALETAGPVVMLPKSDPVLGDVFAAWGRDWLLIDGGDCWPVPISETKAVTYGVTTIADHEALADLEALWAGRGREVSAPLHPAGFALAVFYQVPPATLPPAPANPLTANFENGLTLTGFEVAGRASGPLTVTPGESLSIRLHWRANTSLQPVTVFIHLGAPDAAPVSGVDGPFCPNVDLMQQSNPMVIIEQRTLQVSAAAPPGDYALRLGLYPTGNPGVRLGVESGDSRPPDQIMPLVLVTIK